MADLTPRCATCKRWERTAWEPRGYYSDCPPAADEPRWGACTLIQMAQTGAEVTIPAYTVDGSGYMATLNCRDDFGCVLHEPGSEVPLPETEPEGDAT